MIRRFQSVLLASSLLFASACTSSSKVGPCGNLATDPANCGQCGHACATGEVCSQGTCALACYGGTTQCGASCVDTRWDPAHCGDCATSCAQGEVCSAGQCGVACLGGSTLCDGLCVDVQNDPAHCGGCNTGCEGDQVCVNGACRLQCPTGTTKCGDACVDLLHDPLHCGDCANSCEAGLVCSSGECQLTCSGGTTQCDGRCVDTLTNPAFCGDCETVCENGEVCSNGQCGLECVGGSTKCDGRCVDTKTDSAHCGDCETICENGEVCSNGKCGLECVGGSTKCDGRCIDTKTDPAHCGSCETVCQNGEVCSNGQCGLECVGGATKCDARCVDTSTDPAHCGNCGTSCQNGEVCSNGQCGLECVGGTTRCDDRCVDVQSDPMHCGGCETACSSIAPNEVPVCLSGTCGSACAVGYAECDGDAETGCETAIAASDPLNCGGCGVQCNSDEVCTGARCLDVAPTVTGTSPANGQTNVPVKATIQVTFSEPVIVTGEWFAIGCTVSGAHTPSNSVVTGGPTTYTIDPNEDFAPNEACTVQIVGSAVADEDTNDPFDTLAADFGFSFTVSPVLFTEDFENGMPANWALFNVDGGIPAPQVSYVNAAWIVREDFAYNSSDHVAFSTSWYAPTGAADDWLMTPALKLPAAGTCTLRWNAIAYDPAYPDGYEVRISTTDQTVAGGLANPALFAIGGENSAWTARSASLEAYAGSTVYVAFRNISNDMFVLLIDDIAVECQ